MTDIGSIVIPITVMLILVGGVTGCVAFYFRFERHRTDVLAGELAKNRELAEQMHARLGELTDRVAAVEQLLRSVG
ncbi:hypothetical protein [Herbidospora sp. RD11066]